LFREGADRISLKVWDTWDHPPSIPVLVLVDNLVKPKIASSEPTVGTFHTKGWSKIFLVIFLTFFGQNIVLKGPESLHTKNFIKIPIGKKLGKNR
jgi:hypothetical protein